MSNRILVCTFDIQNTCIIRTLRSSHVRATELPSRFKIQQPQLLNYAPLPSPIHRGCFRDAGIAVEFLPPRLTTGNSVMCIFKLPYLDSN